MNNKTEQIFILSTSINPTPSTSQKLTDGHQTNTENTENGSNVCRICATTTELVIPIFSGEGLQNNLSDKICKHLPIKVSEEDDLPQVVCFQCASTLLAWHELVQCCVQADAALRSRASASTPVHQTTNDETQQKIKKETLEKKFKEIVRSVERRDPPRYADLTTPPSTQRHVRCDYCAVEFPESSFTEHSAAPHTDSLFRCDDCEIYVDRRDFITHMSQHGLQYANVGKTEQKKIKKPKKENDKIEKKKPEVPGKETSSETKDQGDEKIENKSSNDFSDHSDTEDGFGPLPESVFEAIEDSQDSETNEDEASLLSTPDSNSLPTPPSSETSRPVTRPAKAKSHKKSRTCPICSKVYTASSSFFYHMKHHHRKSKDHECDVCGKKYATRANLVQHGHTHNVECQYQCDTCGKRFKSKASRYIHEQIHNGAKRHSCVQCQRAFRWKTHLTRHLKRHSTERTHVCATCGRGFHVRGDMLRHTRTHAAGSFACADCGLRFAQQRYLKVHMHRKHSANAS